MKRFLYMYLMRDTPDLIRQVAPEHARYWKGLDLSQYLGGPFADRTGGLITFTAASLEEARQLVKGDPFLLENLIDQMWVQEWLVE